jgi:hypothetical protein
MFVHAKLGRDRLAGHSVRTSQNDAAPLRQRSGDALATHLPPQIAPLLGTQHQPRARRGRWIDGIYQRRRCADGEDRSEGPAGRAFELRYKGGRARVDYRVGR